MEYNNLNNKRVRHPTERGKEYQESIAKKRHFSASNIEPSKGASMDFSTLKPPLAVQVPNSSTEDLPDLSQSDFETLLEVYFYVYFIAES